MSSHDGSDSASNGSSSRPAPPALLGKKPLLGARSSEEARRNRLNMEKMILKNVSGARISTKNRGQQIVEALKKKRLQGDGAEDERALKKKKTAAVSSESTTARAVAAGILSPARRSSTGALPATSATAGATFTSPTRRHPLPTQRSPTPQRLSPARVRLSGAPLHLSSPVRPPRNPVMASPARPKRSGNTASPLRRNEFLTSPLRHRASASPKRPLMFDDASMAAGEAATVSTSTINGHPPLLASALDQVELAPQAKAPKSSAKSPFQSFQAKFNVSRQSPARARPTASPNTRNSESGPPTAPRSGPMMVDLAHSDEATQTTVISTVPVSASLSTANTVEGATSSVASVPVAAPSVPIQATKPVRKLFAARQVVAEKSLCFSTEGVASSLDVTPDGEIIIVGFTDGAVRLYEMDSSVPSDRHGYLLGHIDETSSQGYSSFHLRVKITPDGRYVFVGCRQGPRVVMTINLDQYRTEKEGDDDEFQKHFNSQSRLRGFADVTTYVPPTEITELHEQKRSAYYVLTGLGVGYLNLWRFIEAGQGQDEPIWNHLQNFNAGGNTATVGAFLASSSTPGVLAIAAASKDKCLRVWPLEYKKSSGLVESNDDSASEVEETGSLSGAHVVTTHFNVPNTTETFAIHGQYVYSISLMGEAYRIRLPDAAQIAGSEGERPTRQSFELQKLDSGGCGKSRRSNIMLESLSATDDGKAIVAVSTEGIIYYANQLPDVDSTDPAVLRIIGKNASENTLFKTPMKVYTPVTSSKGATTKAESMMAVVTNPTAEDSDEYAGYFNVDPTEVFAARWMVPSRGDSCWVCGVRNVTHWPGPPTELKIKAASKAAVRTERRRQRALRQAEEAAARQSSSPETPTNVKTKTTPRPSAKKASAQKKKHKQVNAVEQDHKGLNGSQPSSASFNKKHRKSHNNDEDDEDNTGSDDDHSSASTRVVPPAPAGPSVTALMNELEHFKKRNAEIKTEWQRRLQGERQLRRKWKQREDEFLEQLNDSLTKLDTAEVEVDRLKVLLRDAEKRFAFEKARVEQENSVKARYEQLCEQMNEKMALVADQKRLLEQTTRSLLTEVDRNVHALKNAVVLEKSECVVCKDQQAVTAIVPCGHLCFCEQDAQTYRRNCTSEYPTCPICQQEIVSLLRIY